MTSDELANVIFKAFKVSNEKQLIELLLVEFYGMRDKSKSKSFLRQVNRAIARYEARVSVLAARAI